MTGTDFTNRADLQPMVDPTEIVSRSINLDVSDWKVRINDRRNNRMKIQFNLSKDEAEAYKNFKEATQPGDVADSEFVKVLFLMGAEAYSNKLRATVEEYVKNNPEQLEEDGINVVMEDDGGVTLEDVGVTLDDEEATTEDSVETEKAD